MIVLGYNFTPAPGQDPPPGWYWLLYTLGPLPGLALLVIGLVLRVRGHRKALWLSWIGVALMVLSFAITF